MGGVSVCVCIVQGGGWKCVCVWCGCGGVWCGYKWGGISVGGLSVWCGVCGVEVWVGWVEV